MKSNIDTKIKLHYHIQQWFFVSTYELFSQVPQKFGEIRSPVAELTTLPHLLEYCPPGIMNKSIILTESQIEEVKNYSLMILVINAPEGYQPCNEHTECWMYMH